MTPSDDAVLGLLALAFAFGSPAAVAQPVYPAGGEFQVNTYTTDWQQSAAVAMRPDGGFAIVWQSEASLLDTDRRSIGARFFGNDGRSTAQQLVNTYVAGHQMRPAVAADGDGNFVVVWQSYGSSESDDDRWSIQAQRFDGNGQPIGGEFQVNTYTTDSQRQPAVAVAADGTFLVVWESGDILVDNDIHCQLFAPDGSFIGSELQVNTYTTGDQERPAVAARAGGTFVVVWDSDGSSESDHYKTSIQGRFIASSGLPMSPQAQVNTRVTESQFAPSVAADAEGAFVVVWQSLWSSDDHDGTSIQGRLYAPNGFPVGSDTQVNIYTTGDQFTPVVAADAEGDFVVVWGSDGSGDGDEDQWSVQGRLYASNSLPIGDQAQISSYTTSIQWHPAVAMSPSGDFVVVWESIGSSGDDDDGYSIQGQLYSRPLFADGFESGDTGGWSSAAP